MSYIRNFIIDKCLCLWFALGIISLQAPIHLLQFIDFYSPFLFQSGKEGLSLLSEPWLKSPDTYHVAFTSMCVNKSCLFMPKATTYKLFYILLWADILFYIMKVQKRLDLYDILHVSWLVMYDNFGYFPICYYHVDMCPMHIWGHELYFGVGTVYE